MAKRKQVSGGRRMIESGKTPVLLGVPNDLIEEFRAAAAAKNMPLTQFFYQAGLKAMLRGRKKRGKSGDSA